jgi:selenocysteine lyase/cysteine desulfurase
MQPGRVGLLSGRPPGGSLIEWFQDPSASPEDEVLFPAGARNFENGGTANHPGAIALLESLELVAAVGQEAIAAHARSLGTRLIAGLDALGLRVVTPREPESRAGIVTFGLPGGVDSERALAEDLQARRIAVSVRYSAGFGGVRVCLNGMNAEGDVDRLLEAVAALPGTKERC